MLKENVQKVHTTDLGARRIKRNLGLRGDLIEWCKELILDDSTQIVRHGKNYYVQAKGCILTINASSYTIITAHKTNGRWE